MSKQTVQVELKLSSVLMVLATLAGLWLLFLLRNIVISIFIAVTLASALEPMIHWLRIKLHIPRPISLAASFLLVLGLLALVGFLLVPPFAHQLNLFVRNLPGITSHAVVVLTGGSADESQIQQFTQSLTDFATGKFEVISGSVVQVGLGAISGVVTAVTIVVISFYLVMEKEQLYQGLALLVPRKDYIRVRSVLEKVQHKLGLWFRGQLLLGIIIGVATGIGLWILGVPYALPLALLAGILELIPIIGPLISMIPAVLIALTISSPLAIFVVLLYLLVQQLEAHLIVPKVMEKAVGLNPLFIIIALLAGGALLGIIGALIAVPVAVVVSIVLEDIREHEHEHEPETIARKRL